MMEFPAELVEHCIQQMGPVFDEEQTATIARAIQAETAEDVEALADWCLNTEVNHGLLENVLERNALLSLSEDGDVQIRLIDKGMDEARAIVHRTAFGVEE